MSSATLQQDALKALICAVVLGVVSTFGDWLWTHFIPDGAVVPGVVHGAVIFFLLAAVLAWASGRSQAWKILMASLPVLGIVIAAAFYPIAMLTKNYLISLLITWIAMWLGTSWLHNKARGGTERATRAVLRGTTAALFSGLAFGAISGIWTSPSPGGPNYLWHLCAWTFAFFPGFLALLLGQLPAARTH